MGDMIHFCHDYRFHTDGLTSVKMGGSRPALIRDVERFIAAHRGFAAYLAEEAISLREGA